jgi:hypothetical protein
MGQFNPCLGFRATEFGTSVEPKTFKLKLLKEIRRRPTASKSRRLIGGKVLSNWRK